MCLHSDIVRGLDSGADGKSKVESSRERVGSEIRNARIESDRDDVRHSRGDKGLLGGHARQEVSGRRVCRWVSVVGWRLRSGCWAFD